MILKKSSGPLPPGSPSEYNFGLFFQSKRLPLVLNSHVNKRETRVKGRPKWDSVGVSRGNSVEFVEVRFLPNKQSQSKIRYAGCYVPGLMHQECEKNHPGLESERTAVFALGRNTSTCGAGFSLLTSKLPYIRAPGVPRSAYL